MQLIGFGHHADLIKVLDEMRNVPLLRKDQKMLNDGTIIELNKKTKKTKKANLFYLGVI